MEQGKTSYLKKTQLLQSCQKKKQNKTVGRFKTLVPVSQVVKYREQKAGDCCNSPSLAFKNLHTTHCGNKSTVLIRIHPLSPGRSQRRKRAWPEARKGSRRAWRRRSWWRQRRSRPDEPGRVWPTPAAPVDCPAPSRTPWHFSLATRGRCWPALTSCPNWPCWGRNKKNTNDFNVLAHVTGEATAFTIVSYNYANYLKIY